MLKIRLQRIGKRGQAYFRVVVTEHTTKPKGKYLELLGSYDPHKNEVKADAERVKYWLGQGAQLSPTVNNLLVGRDIIEGEKVRAWRPKKKETAMVQSTTPAKTEEGTVTNQEAKEESGVEKSVPEKSEPTENQSVSPPPAS